MLMSPTTAESQKISLLDRGMVYHIDATSMSSVSHGTGGNDGSVGLSGNNANNNLHMNPPVYSWYPNQIHQMLENALPVCRVHLYAYIKNGRIIHDHVYCVERIVVKLLLHRRGVKFCLSPSRHPVQETEGIAKHILSALAIFGYVPGFAYKNLRQIRISSPKIRQDQGSPIGSFCAKGAETSLEPPPAVTNTIDLQMDDCLYDDFRPLQMEDVPSSLLGDLYEIESPTQPSFAFSQDYPYNYLSDFDSVKNEASLTPTPLEYHFSEGHSPYVLSTADSPFLSSHTEPFLSDVPLYSPATPSTSLEPDSDSQLLELPIFVTVSDLTSSSSPSVSSSSFPEDFPDPSLSTEAEAQPAHQDLSPSRDKRKCLQSDLQASSASNSGTEFLSHSPRLRSEFFYHKDDESDSDMVYHPSPGPSIPKKRTRSTRTTKYFGEKDGRGDELQFVADGSKKSRGRKVPVAPKFRQDDQAKAESHTVLPSIPFDVNLAGAPNKDTRRYVCTYEGCGKCFTRGPNLRGMLRVCI
ncbi:uncharacterized protein BT62DRAFT_998341 [Guyanagaster necrorhizus]|uniref:Uncharacterized protein n=1 Tax=Guyanagaster necrorhizus TaxID=856835 RepID=A0A9P8AL33_9AGAR|nr:uncharacterized protein BT62DRAFT_998341 [Guyanagaster necrorhizus MCA 3950]KAG7439309.1 hypothetical protein BT62DRAFT_998341 [Guyanagaster necrorhizus MCA 3950]